MSEAANSHFDPDLSESSVSVSSTEAVSHPPEPVTVTSGEDDWQTVDLPGAVSVDAILAGAVNLAEIAALEPATAAIPSTHAIAQLDQENAILREQIQQLEQDLTQAQIELQLEIARSLYSQPTDPIAAAAPGHPATESLDAAAPQLEQLAQELELAQQAAQRQQILVETLTNQLHSSQERIAQLERECALTQQRYNEQMQQLLQSENTCRDLRMRLMRQQQHTLQFKAALEKCLDMPAALQQHSFMQHFEVDEPAIANPEAAANQLGHAPFVPKAHPVKPWSTEADSAEGFYTTAGFDLSGLPNLLSRLRHSEDLEIDREQDSSPLDLAGNPINHPTAGFGTEPLPADEPQQIGELLDLMFPDASEAPVEAIVATTPTAEPIFDLSPFMAAGEVTAPMIEPMPESEMYPAAAMSPSSGASMWDDLAQLIDSTDPAATTELDAESEATPTPTSVTGLLAVDNLNHPVDESTGSEPPSTPMASSPRPILLAFPSAHMATAVKASAELSSEPDSIAAHDSSTWAYQLDQSTPLDSTAPAPANFETASAIPANWPSPVLYPLRPTKRLPSLAAVELPTFRRG
ncbi:hypothetical protein [Pantanalinema sp. GBBB05]|uniref:hypothetical protein n=1 Tax=Pantanalinema sp. GBBB05 TaxID=2604139 RepID=UPI001E099581|nr:hypothetical protein [Pantanalinema sp. GBBB05]